MRGPVRKELIKRFTAELVHQLPSFMPCGKERAAGGNLYKIWAWEVAQSLTFFIMLQPFEREDQFTVEVGWSDDGKYPWHEDGMRYFKVESPRARRRLVRLWSTVQMEPVWEIVRSLTYEETSALIKAQGYHPDPEEAKRIKKLVDVPVEEAVARVEPLVKDAVQKLVEYAMPFFRRVVERHGLRWPDEACAPTPRLTA